tara:strand:- start:3048 stop:3299 length:252 start_codon:yes stop_codon:yes gene_type:complete
VHPQFPCPQSKVPGSQFIVHIIPEQSGACSAGIQESAWQHESGTQSEFSEHSLLTGSILEGCSSQAVIRNNAVIKIVKKIGLE